MNGKEQRKLKVKRLLKSDWKTLGSLAQGAYILAVVAYVGGAVASVLIIRRIDSGWEYAIPFMLKDLCLVIFLGGLSLILQWKSGFYYNKSEYIEQKYERKLSDIDSRFAEIARYWHSMSHTFRNRFCKKCHSSSVLSEIDIKDILVTFCNNLSWVMQKYFDKDKNTFYVVVKGFVDKERVITMARNDNNEGKNKLCTKTSYRKPDLRGISIKGKTAYQEILDAIKKREVWGHDNIKDYKSYHPLTEAHKELYDAIVVAPVRKPLEGKNKGASYELAGFLMVYTPLSKPGKERMFCKENERGEDYEVVDAVENFVAAFADILFIVIKREETVGVKDMVRIGESEYVLDEKIFKFVEEVNESFTKSFY